MRERPILFSGPMVRAILDGRKTQTRRVVKGVSNANCIPVRGATVRRGTITHVLDAARYCPYGKPGDRLWVRETWAYAPAAVYAKVDRDGPFVYAADGDGYGRTLSGQWTPSIHMPRWASRLTLEVTSVRVERLQGISYDDMRAEGMAVAHPLDPTEVFRETWDSLNATRGFGWDANPWVWVIEFRRAA